MATSAAALRCLRHQPGRSSRAAALSRWRVVPEAGFSSASVAQSHPVPGTEVRPNGYKKYVPTPVTLHFIDPNQGGRRITVQAETGDTVVDVAKRQGIDIHAACGQKLQCATCHVILQKAFHARLPPPSVREQDMLETAYTLTDTSRLGCQVRLTAAMDGMQLTLPSKAAKGLVNMSLDQPRPLVRAANLGVSPAVMPSMASQRRTQAMSAAAVPADAAELPRPLGMAYPAPSAPSSASSEWERLFMAERARNAIIEQKLLEFNIAEAEGKQAGKGGQKGKSSPGMTASGGASETEDKDKDKDEMEKFKEELAASCIVQLDKAKAPSFEQVVGLRDAKRVLRESILWPALGPPELFQGIRGRCRGVLLYGPPGCGKTMVARAAAAELCSGTSSGDDAGSDAATFFHVRPADVMSKFYGDSQRRILALEELAKERSPAIVFLDEVDTLLGKRDGGQGVAEHHKGVTNALLTWMDGFDQSADRVFFIGATNRADAIDEAALRRFGDLTEVGLPDEEQRRDLLETIINGAMKDGHRAEVSGAELAEVAQQTAGMSGDDVSRLVQQAFLEVLRDLPEGVHRGLTLDMVPPVTVKHLAISLKHRVKSSGEVYKSLQQQKRN